MSLLDWIIVILVSILIVVVGYAGVTGKSIFSFKKKQQQDNHKEHH